MDAQSIILHILAIPLLICYGLIIKVLIKRRKHELNGIFFHVCIVLGILDMFRVVTWFIFILWPRFVFRDFYLMIGQPGYNLNFWFGNIANSYCTIVSRVFNVILGVNRMTAMAIPLRHPIIWAEKSVKTVIIGLILSVICHLPYAIINMNGAHYKPVGANLTGLATVAYNPTPFAYSVWAASNMGIAFLSVVLFIIMYSIAFYFARKHLKAEDANRRSGDRGPALFNKLDFKLALAAFINAIIQTIMSTYFILISLYPQEVILNDIMAYYGRWDLIILVDAFITPAMLVTFSDIVREQLRLTYLGPSNQIVPMN